MSEGPSRIDLASTAPVVLRRHEQKRVPKALPEVETEKAEPRQRRGRGEGGRPEGASPRTPRVALGPERHEGEIRGEDEARDAREAGEEPRERADSEAAPLEGLHGQERQREEQRFGVYGREEERGRKEDEREESGRDAGFVEVEANPVREKKKGAEKGRGRDEVPGARRLEAGPDRHEAHERGVEREERVIRLVADFGGRILVAPFGDREVPAGVPARQRRDASVHLGRPGMRRCEPRREAAREKGNEPDPREPAKAPSECLPAASSRPHVRHVSDDDIMKP